MGTYSKEYQAVVVCSIDGEQISFTGNIMASYSEALNDILMLSMGRRVSRAYIRNRTVGEWKVSRG